MSGKHACRAAQQSFSDGSDVYFQPSMFPVKKAQRMLERSNGTIHGTFLADFIGVGDPGMLGKTESHTNNSNRSGNSNAWPDRRSDYSYRGRNSNSPTYQPASPNS